MPHLQRQSPLGTEPADDCFAGRDFLEGVPKFCRQFDAAMRHQRGIVSAMAANASPDFMLRFDDAGNYKPNKDNTNKDSLSLGLSFTMVGAKF